MALLTFDKPKKIRSTAEHNRMHTSDSGVDGTYVPNMSEADKKRWKGKHIKGDNERIEIRKSFPMAQVVIVVRKNPPVPMPKFDYAKMSASKVAHDEYERQGKLHQDAKNNIKISMNGSLWLSFKDWREIEQVVAEACGILNVQAF